MTPAQTAKYFGEWGRVRDVLKARGQPCGDVERHKLHLKALGVRKSSKDFTNADLDKVLAAFYAITRPADLKAQLQQLDQAQHRHSDLLERARDLAAQCVSKPGLEGRYLDGMSERVFHVAKYHLLDERRLAQLCGILRRRIAQLQRGQRAAGKQAAGELHGAVPPADNPF